MANWKKHDPYKQNGEWNGYGFVRVMGGQWVEQDGVVPVTENIHNLLSFSGYYYEKKIDSTTEEDIVVNFDKGECPLTFVEQQIDDGIGGNGSVFQTIHLDKVIEAGKHIDLTLIFPIWSAEGFSYSHKGYDIWLKSNEEHPTGAFGMTLSMISYNEENDGSLVHKDFYGQISQDLLCEKLQDDSGYVIGVRLRGTLDYNLTGIDLMSCYYGLTPYSAISATMTTTFKSHDDLTLIVT